jgi:hypothetical protein
MERLGGRGDGCSVIFVPPFPPGLVPSSKRGHFIILSTAEVVLGEGGVIDGLVMAKAAIYLPVVSLTDI